MAQADIHNIIKLASKPSGLFRASAAALPHHRGFTGDPLCLSRLALDHFFTSASSAEGILLVASAYPGTA